MRPDGTDKNQAWRSSDRVRCAGEQNLCEERGTRQAVADAKHNATLNGVDAEYYVGKAED